MQQLIYFLQKNKYFFYFVLLEAIAFSLILNSHSFHKSKFLSSTNYIAGSIYKQQTNILEYLKLKKINQELYKENELLKNELQKIKSINQDKIIKNIDSTNYNQQFSFLKGKIIKNDYHTAYNHLVINKGKKNGVKKEMGVINPKGIIGIIDKSSKSYARVISILNKDIKINAKLKKSYHFGTLMWNGKDKKIVQLTDIPRQAKINIGDTIVTGGKSIIFPEGILIGTVKTIPEKATASNTLNIKLFNDMTNLSNIYVIISYNKLEVELLKKSLK